MANKELLRKVWRWTRRGLVALLVLLVLSAVGFELWRQNDISSADAEVEEAQARLNRHFEGTPSFDEWREALMEGTNGQDYFIEEFLRQLHNYQVDFPDNPVERIQWRVWQEQPTSDETPPTGTELSDWLAATQPIADAVAGFAPYDRIVLDPDHPAFEMAGTKRITTVWFFSLGTSTVAADRVVALVAAGNTEQAISEYRNLRALASKLDRPASWMQWIYLRLLADSVERLQWRLAAENLLAADEFSEDPVPVDWHAALSLCCKATLLWARDTGPSALIALPEEGGNSPAWFAWLNPGNYDEWDELELVRLSLMYSYERRAYADWIDYSLHSLEPLRTGTPLPTAPDNLLGTLIPRTAHWGEQQETLKETTGPGPWTEMRQTVLAIRRLQKSGSPVDEIAAELRTLDFLDVAWTEASCELRFKHSEEVWNAFDQRYETFPDSKEFYAMYPPVVVQLD